jgi:hypothetical protein
LSLLLSLKGVGLSKRWRTLKVLPGPSLIYTFGHEYSKSAYFLN